ncbi:hypothetical protein Tco_1293485 [Tanacetum coccineum]
MTIERLMKYRKKDHFHCPLWIKCSKDSRENHTIVSSMALGLFSDLPSRSLALALSSRGRQHSLGYTESLPNAGMHHFGLCNAPGTFQRCMMAIFHDMIEKTMEVVHGMTSQSSGIISNGLSHLEKIQTIDQSAGGKLRDLNAEESWVLLEDLALYDNESWNDPRNFAKSVKAISLPQDVPEGLVFDFMASQDARLSKFEADFKQQQSEMTNKIDTVLKAITDRIAGALPSDTVKNLKLNTSLVLSARSYPTEDPQCSTQIHSSINAITIHSKQQIDPRDDRTKENEEEEKDIPENIHFDSSTPPNPSVLFITEKVLKLNSFFESLGLVPPLSNAELVYTKEKYGDVMFIEIVPKDDASRMEEPKAGEQEVGYFDIFPTKSELAYHKYLMCSLIPSIFLRNPIIMEGCPSNLKIPCNIGHVHVEKAYIDLNSPLNIMTRMMYNWIMRRKLEDRNRGMFRNSHRLYLMGKELEVLRSLLDDSWRDDLTSFRMFLLHY